MNAFYAIACKSGEAVNGDSAKACIADLSDNWKRTYRALLTIVQHLM